MCKKLKLFLALVLKCEGLISIDCGSSTSYDDAATGQLYVPDASYINSGESKTVAPKYNDNLSTRYNIVRSFPEGTQNCYNLKPLDAGAGKFLIGQNLFMEIMED